MVSKNALVSGLLGSVRVHTALRTPPTLQTLWFTRKRALNETKQKIRGDIKIPEGVRVSKDWVLFIYTGPNTKLLFQNKEK